MTNPYDPYPGQPPGQGADPYAGPQQPYSQPAQQFPPQADAAAPTQFVPVQQPAPQLPQQPYYGAQQQWPQQQAYPQQPPQQAYPQQQVPQQPYPQQPGPYDQLSQSQSQPQPQSPYGVPTQQQPYPPYGAPQQPFGGYPAPMTVAEAKAQRGTGAKVASAVFGTVPGRLAILALIAVCIGVFHVASGPDDGSGSRAGATTTSTGAATDAPTDSATAAGTSTAIEVDIDALKKGDCFDASSASTGIESFTVVPCTQAHDSQVYGTSMITADALPDAATLNKDADTDCGSLAKLNLSSSSLPSDAEKPYYAPEDEDSFDQGFNFIICTIQTPSKELTKSYVTAS
ncbi:septum formation family protein [Actinospica durhamensis]|uniref:Septum formation family protein n=1 Tax=Actinospica durhamensis TaxID=1508375 RepID=A0A941IML8_9ACTN|nr:septum formation family protein [Actinospica durhamensis]MBR7834315.1 septum formation family protein [Actinospica durhamensis]